MIVDFSNEKLPYHIVSDLAGENIIYIYLSDDKKVCLSSINIEHLLLDKRIPRPLKVEKNALFYLLHYGAVPTPYTPYENIYKLGIGDSILIKKQDHKFELDFKNDFPFKNKNRGTDKVFDEKKLFHF